MVAERFQYTANLQLMLATTDKCHKKTDIHSFFIYIYFLSECVLWRNKQTTMLP